MKKLIPILLIFFSCQKQELRQEPKTFGAVGNPDVEYQFKRGGGKGKPTPPPPDTTTTPTDTTTNTPPPQVLPYSYELWMPPVMNQGSEGACTAFGAANARASEHYYTTGQSVTLSPEYLFYYCKTDNTCGSGTLLGALRSLQSYGVCTNASMPFSWLNGCSTAPDASQSLEAAWYKIRDYQSISAIDSISLKKALLANHALVIQITPDQAFCDAGPGFIWNSFTWALGAHVVALCGYDDGKQAWKIINSWGTSWGDSGYGWISYSLFPSVSSSAFKMIL